MTKHLLGLQVKWFNCFIKIWLLERNSVTYRFWNEVLFDSLVALGKFKKKGEEILLRIFRASQKWKKAYEGKCIILSCSEIDPGLSVPVLLPSSLPISLLFLKICRSSILCNFPGDLLVLRVHFQTHLMIIASPRVRRIVTQA